MQNLQYIYIFLMHSHTVLFEVCM